MKNVHISNYRFDLRLSNVFVANTLKMLLFFLYFCNFAFGALPTTVSVLYFQNLSEDDEKPYISKALAEMLTSELSNVDAITLVEREQLEKTLKEMALGQSGLINDTAGPQVGQMLGANYLITGSYFVKRSKITITEKLLEVSTGKIISTGTVEGKTNDMNDIVNKLLEQSIIGLQKINTTITASSTTRKNAPVELSTVNKYGEALDLVDNNKSDEAKTILSSITQKEPNFYFAKITLRDVQKRIAELSRQHDKEMGKLANNEMTYMLFIQLATSYLTSNRYDTLFIFCQKYRSNPPVAPLGSQISGAELVDYYLLSAAYALSNYSFYVQQGELFLRHYPTSIYFNSIKTQMGVAALQAENKSNNEKKLSKELSSQLDMIHKFTGTLKDSLCFEIARQYSDNQLYEKAALFGKMVDVKSLLEVQTISGDFAVFTLFLICYHTADKKAASKLYDLMERNFSESPYFEGMRSMKAVLGE